MSETLFCLRDDEPTSARSDVSNSDVSDVSDYVAGRLDPVVARDVERRARHDARLAAAILDAKAVRRRVERRLKLPG